MLLLIAVLGLSVHALASSTATITVSGAERQVSGNWDTNSITISFNGFSETVSPGQFSTVASIASAFAGKFSRDYANAGLSAQVICGSSNSLITFTLQGSTAFGALGVTGSTTSFQMTSTGFQSGGLQTPVITWPTPAAISYGTALSATQLDATASVAGTFVYSPALGTVLAVGLNTLSVTFYPTDTTDYATVSIVITLQVLPVGSGSPVYSFNVSYDSASNLTGYTDSIMGSWGFGYDTLNRLQSSNVTSGSYAGVQINWGYDPFGNRTSETFSGSSDALLPTSTTTSYNVYNQILSSSLGVVHTDGAGDVTSDTQNQYVYDAEGRICEVRSMLVGTMTGYIYGADGTRVSTGSVSTWGNCDPTVNGYQATKDSILGPSGGQLTETSVDTNGNVTWAHTNVWVGNQLLASYDPNGLHFYLSDWVGSRRVQSDYQGDIEQTCTNLPYGDGESCAPTPSEELFAGLARDSESELDHAMYRQYSSVFGRWTVPDPYGGSSNLFDTQTLNRYAYVNGTPLTTSDRSGLDGLSYPLSYLAGGAADSSLFVSNLIGVLSPFAFAFDIFELGKDFGLWDTGPKFYGNVTASQSGKNVPNAPSNPQVPVHGPWHYGNFCGAGGMGTPINAIDAACQHHDQQFGATGADWTNMQSEANWNKLTPQQKTAVQQANQDLCNAMAAAYPSIPSWNLSQSVADIEIYQYFALVVPQGAQCHP
jgi:RHS repeat-associated protein